MRKEYDFSKGERGKFYRAGVKLSLPIYLEPDVEAFVRKYANKKKVDRQKIVNKWLRSNIEMVKSVL